MAEIREELKGHVSSEEEDNEGSMPLPRSDQRNTLTLKSQKNESFVCSVLSVGPLIFIVVDINIIESL